MLGLDPDHPPATWDEHFDDNGWSMDLPTFRKMNNIDWAVASLPEGPVKKATYIAGEGLAVFKQSRNPDVADINQNITDAF